jgi:hypothetical protein
MNGLPPELSILLIANYQIVVVFPLWALVVYAFIFLLGQTAGTTFNIELWGMKFKGSGGAAIVWVLATIGGILTIAHYWQR